MLTYSQTASPAMRRVPRAHQVIDLLSISSQPWRRPQSVCRACERRTTTLQCQTTAPFTTTTSLSRRMRAPQSSQEELERKRAQAAREKLNLTEEELAKFQAMVHRRKQEVALDEYNDDIKQAREEGREIPDASAGSAVDATYKAASTWDGLEWVGSRQWVDQQHDTGVQFESFTTPAKYVSEGVAKNSIARAVKEIEILESMGLPLDTASKAHISANLDRFFGPGGYANDAQVDAQLQEIFSGEPASLSQMESVEVASLPEVDISNTEYKFAIVKRVMQLTGIRIPDPVIGRSTTTTELLSVLTEKPKPTKLADVLKQDERIADLPNVKVAKRRVTPIDKEREVGRWKVIEKELMDMGLPVVGH